MSTLGDTPHVKLRIDAEGQLYIYCQNSGDKQLIPMRNNPDGSKTSRGTGREIEEAIWEFRYDHKDVKKVASKDKVKGEAPEASS